MTIWWRNVFLFFLRTKILRHFAQRCILIRPSPLTIVKWIILWQFDEGMFFVFLKTKILRHFAQWCIWQDIVQWQWLSKWQIRDNLNIRFLIFLRTNILRHFWQWCIFTRPSPVIIILQPVQVQFLVRSIYFVTK